MAGLTPDLRLLGAPSETYRSLVAAAGAYADVPLRALARVAVPAVIAGIATAITATGRISWRLALSGTACWSLIAILQFLTAMAVVGRSPRRVSLTRAIELLFTGHAAWSLWLLTAAALLIAAPATIRQDVVLFTAVLPFVWTAVVTYGFCREVLGLDRRRAAARTAIHQALTAVLILFYVGWAVQLWPRILGLQIP